MKSIFACTLLGLSILISSHEALAWGGRGHDSICQTAVYLVENKTLKDFLRNKPNIMGHLCNIPDITWRSLPSAQTKEGNPTHFTEGDPIGLETKDIPTDLSILIQKYTKTENKLDPKKQIMSVPHEIGTNWWRANQLYNLSVSEGLKLKTLPAPSNSKEEQDDNLAYNKVLFNMLTTMGIMGHFVGDNSMPFHTTADYDGYGVGHGGIHAYYEDLAVSYFGADLHVLIEKKAKELKKTSSFKKVLNEKTTLDKMKALGVLSNKEVAAVLKLDPLIKKSILKEEKGMKIKTPAERKSAEIGQKIFANLIIEQLARSTLLLANLWDHIYTDIEKPELKAYKSYRYPLNPDFIMPDYYEIKSEIKK
jgi:hypothetical protein